MVENGRFFVYWGTCLLSFYHIFHKRRSIFRDPKFKILCDMLTFENTIWSRDPKRSIQNNDSCDVTYGQTYEVYWQCFLDQSLSL